MLVLVPSPLSQASPQAPILAADLPLVHSIRTWVVENAKPARAALNAFNMPVPIHTLNLVEAEQCSPAQRDALLLASTPEAPLGLMSDAGCPGIADPGTNWALRAHELKLAVHPLVGPCSPTLALMASGLVGQCFVFHGYPPIHPQDCAAWIRDTKFSVPTQSNNPSQKASAKPQKPSKPCTHIAIETPFRNTKFFKILLQTLDEEALVCIAQDLHGHAQRIHTHPAGSWKQLEEQQPTSLELGKIPCIFLWQHPA